MTKEMMEIEYNRARTLLSADELEKIEEARNILEELDDYKDSKKFLDEAKLKINEMQIEIDEKKEEDYERAILLMKEKKSAQRLDQAIKLFNDALELDPQKEQILNNIGVCWLSLQEPDEAIIYFKKALERPWETCGTP